MCECEAKPRQATLEVKRDHDRHCTDLLALLLFLVLWVAAVALLVIANGRGGDPLKIIHGVSVEGEICGIDNNEKYVAWPSTTDPNVRVCVDSCAETANWTGGFAYKSEAFLFYCLPVTQNNSATTAFNSGEAHFSRMLSDLYTARFLLLASLFCSLLLSFVYTKLIERCGRCLVWGFIVLLFAAGAGTSFYFLKEAYVSDTTNKDVETLRTIGWVALVATVIFFIIVVALRKRINLALEVVREAAEALIQMPCLVAMPIFPFFSVTIFCSIWLVGLLVVGTVWDSVITPLPQDVKSFPLFQANNVTEYKSQNFDKDMQDVLYLYFFHFLWNVQFWVYFTYMVVSGSVADWYFSAWNAAGSGKKRGEGYQELSDRAVTESCNRTCRFHLGSVAFGSAIIATIQFLRAIVKAIESTAKTEGEPNQIQKAILCMMACCLKCVESCMNKINKNSFVWISIYGDNFIPSTCSAFQLMWANLLRLTIVDVVGDYLLLIGKVFVSCLTTALCLFFLTSERDLSSLALPTIMVFIIAYIVATLFMLVFETAVDTIFLCFLIDESNPNQLMLASPSLKRIVESVDANVPIKQNPVNDVPALEPDVTRGAGYSRF